MVAVAATDPRSVPENASVRVNDILAALGAGSAPFSPARRYAEPTIATGSVSPAAFRKLACTATSAFKGNSMPPATVPHPGADPTSRATVEPGAEICSLSVTASGVGSGTAVPSHAIVIRASASVANRILQPGTGVRVRRQPYCDGSVTHNGLKR